MVVYKLLVWLRQPYCHRKVLLSAAESKLSVSNEPLTSPTLCLLKEAISNHNEVKKLSCISSSYNHFLNHGVRFQLRRVRVNIIVPEAITVA